MFAYTKENTQYACSNCYEVCKEGFETEQHFMCVHCIEGTIRENRPLTDYQRIEDALIQAGFVPSRIQGGPMSGICSGEIGFELRGCRGRTRYIFDKDGKCLRILAYSH